MPLPVAPVSVIPHMTSRHSMAKHLSPPLGDKQASNDRFTMERQGGPGRWRVGIPVIDRIENKGSPGLDRGGIWPGSRGIWSGSRGVWSESRGVWPGTRRFWSGLRGIWPGSRAVWSGQRGFLARMEGRLVRIKRPLARIDCRLARNEGRLVRLEGLPGQDQGGF